MYHHPTFQPSGENISVSEYSKNHHYPITYLHSYFQNLVDYKVICWLYYSLFHMLWLPRKTTSNAMYTLAILMKKKWLWKLCLPLIYREWKHNQSPQIGWCWLKKVWVVREWIPNYYFFYTNWIFRNKRNTETFHLQSTKQKDKGGCQLEAAAPLYHLSSCLQEGDSGKIIPVVGLKATKRSGPGDFSLFLTPCLWKLTLLYVTMLL